MDVFPDIRAFSLTELVAFLAALTDEAEAITTEQHATTSDEASLAYRRQILNNKIHLVRAELAARGGPPDPSHGDLPA